MTSSRWGIGTLAAILLLGVCIGNALDSAQEPVASESARAQEKSAAKNRKAELPPWHKNLQEWKGIEDPDVADNSFCYVCHLNYEEEELTTIHTPHGIGCEVCHGISDTHSEDEDSVTPPDVMFSKKRVLQFCTECHAQDDLAGEDEHDELFGAGTAAKKTCTDCHAEKHALEVRTRKWNKTTGKLIWDDGVRMMEEKP